ncbi:electron transfer flavoprotein subunit alpha/FixB family protein [uncultured Aquabacterium sp.]|uniref:electron transfer flavoprotein subunit alpha/FixB family protein n=1 Tax=Aquabacterium sp. TaxID=1872578 RepID=UPI0025E4EB52|nr:electron transfer flavoprotein subunit alpha/FixB family protein [uncultured Aquabacterium sp.]
MNHLVDPGLLQAAPTGLPRVDPRRPAVIAPSGLRRIVLGSTEGERLTARTAHDVQARGLRAAGPFRHCVLVVCHTDRGTLDGHARQVVALAAMLATADTEVVLATLGPCHDDVADMGADRLLCLPDAVREQHGLDAAAQWLTDLHQQLRPTLTCLPDHDADADLGRRFAAGRQLTLAASVVEVQRHGAGLHWRVRVNAREDALCSAPQVALLAPGVARTDLPFVGLGRRWDADEHGMPPRWPAQEDAGLEDLGVEPGDARTVALEEADFILAAGNGVTDLALFQQLADALGAATGASRVAVDDGRFPRSKQIGATGKTVKATTYLAVGISGAVQHLQGIKDCRHVIAVNTDAAAPMARRAALMAVEDSTALMRELLALVQAHRQARKETL